MVYRDSSVGIRTGYGLDGGGFDSQQGTFLFFTASRRALGPIQPIELVPGVKLTIHLHLVPRSRMPELYLYSPYIFMT
jgi:hypothetical protein